MKSIFATQQFVRLNGHALLIVYWGSENVGAWVEGAGEAPPRHVPGHTRP